jgi:hypothetical protein
MSLPRFASIRVDSRFNIQNVSALRGRIALPGEVSCRMQDTAGETPALPFEEAASS